MRGKSDNKSTGQLALLQSDYSSYCSNVIRNDLSFAKFGARPILVLPNHPLLVKPNDQEATGRKNEAVLRLTNYLMLLDLVDCELTIQDT